MMRGFVTMPQASFFPLTRPLPSGRQYSSSSTAMTFMAGTTTADSRAATPALPSP